MFQMEERPVQKPRVDRARGRPDQPRMAAAVAEEETGQRWDRGGQQGRVGQGRTGMFPSLTLRMVHGSDMFQVLEKGLSGYCDNNGNSYNTGHHSLRSPQSWALF